MADKADLIAAICDAIFNPSRWDDAKPVITWYPEPGIRFMASWVNVFQYSPPFNRPDLSGIHPNLFEFRAQVAW